jgi:plastocyanin
MRKLIALTAAAGVTAALAVPAFAATRTVQVRDDVFAPKSLTVSKNTTLRFVWRGKNPHNVVVSKGPQRFSSGGVKVKGSYSVKVRKAGSYTIVCQIHPGMTMKLRVR